MEKLSSNLDLIGSYKNLPQVRESNVEVLRLIATFFIIFIHSNFLSLGVPQSEDFICNPISTLIRTLFETLGIIGVNCFIFISGWFGILLKIKGIVNLLFQCAWFYILISLIFNIIGITTFELSHIKRYLFADDWFIVCYLLLMILSPILNSFVENTRKEVFRNVLILYFLFTFTYGTISSLSAFNGGYSTIFFIGYYLLIRYIRIHRPKFSSMPMIFDILMYLSISVLLCLLFRYKIPVLGNFSYLNPLIILSSIHFSLIFTKFSYKSRTVNWLAASAFSVYLLHGVPGIFNQLKSLFYYLFSTCSTLEFWVLDIAIIFLIIIISIILDQPRKRIFNYLINLKNVRLILKKIVLS